MRLAVTRICPICKHEFRKNLWKHFWNDHKDLKLTDSEFVLKLNNLTEVPKCKICNNLAKLNYCKYTFYDTCGNTSCGAKIRFNHKDKINLNYTCICGRSFSKLSSYASHTKYCIEYCNTKGRLPCKSNLINYNKTAWNKGLTKELDERVKRRGETLSNRYNSGELIHYNKGKKYSEERCKQISESRKEFLKLHPEKVPYVINHHSKGDSYPERYFKEVFNNNNIKYEQNYHCLGFFLDFAWPDKKIYLEIDGEQHYKDERIAKHDIYRTKLLSDNGWNCLVRLRWTWYRSLSKPERESYIKDLISKINSYKELP